MTTTTQSTPVNGCVVVGAADQLHTCVAVRSDAGGDAAKQYVRPLPQLNDNTLDNRGHPLKQFNSH